MRIAIGCLVALALVFRSGGSRPAIAGPDEPSKPSGKAKKRDSRRESAKEAPPDAEAQASILVGLKQLYKPDYAKKTRAGVLALAEKLYQDADEGAGTSAERFVLLRETRDLAVRAADPDLAMRAIDSLGRRFTINAADMKREALAKIGAKTTSSTIRRAVVQAALAASREAVAADALDAAVRLAEVAKKAAGGAPLLVKAAWERIQYLETLREELPDIQAARRTLRRQPRDGEANRVVGKFLCLAQGKWGEGMALLAKGSDPLLQELAKEWDRSPINASDRAGLADQLWSWSEKEKASARTDLREQARRWYWKAVPDLRGLEKTKVEGRLKIIYGKLVLKPGLVTEMFNDTKFAQVVKTRIDYQIDYDWGQGSPDPEINKDNFGVRWWGYLKPPRPGIYTLRIKSDNGCRIWIDRVPVVNHLTTGNTYDLTVKVNLADRPHVFLVEFLEGILTAYIHVHWIPPGETEALPVPAESFYHSPQQEKLLRR